MVKGVIPRPMRPALGCPCNRLQERVARDAQIAWHHIHLGALRQLHVWRQDYDAVLHRSGITHGLNILSAAQARKHGLPPIQPQKAELREAFGVRGACPPSAGLRRTGSRFRTTPGRRAGFQPALDVRPAAALDCAGALAVPGRKAGWKPARRQTLRVAVHPQEPSQLASILEHSNAMDAEANKLRMALLPTGIA